MKLRKTFYLDREVAVGIERERKKEDRSASYWLNHFLKPLLAGRKQMLLGKDEDEA